MFIFDDSNNAPFFSNIEQIPFDIKTQFLKFSYIYKTKGYGHFLASLYSYNRSYLFSNVESIQYMKYWINHELKIRYFAWKFYYKIKNKILKKQEPQNETLLDFTTLVSEDKNPVYVYSRFKYWIYSINEIKNIILQNLLKCDLSEPQPLAPCNAYTNEILTFGQMMNIYLQIGHLKLHPYIHSYAKRYFDLTMFSFYNNNELSNNAVKHHLSQLDNIYLYEISEYFKDPVEEILKRHDIPLFVKHGIMKKFIMEEPVVDEIHKSPLFSLYNISQKGKRKMRKAKKPQRRQITNSFSFREALVNHDVNTL